MADGDFTIDILTGVLLTSGSGGTIVTYSPPDETLSYIDARIVVQETTTSEHALFSRVDLVRKETGSAPTIGAFPGDANQGRTPGDLTEGKSGWSADIAISGNDIIVTGDDNGDTVRFYAVLTIWRLEQTA